MSERGDNLIARELRAILAWLKHHFDAKERTEVRFDWSIGPVTNKKTKVTPMDLVITNEQQAVAHITPKTHKGVPAKLDGPPVWTVTAGSCTVTPAPDGLSAVIASGDDAGDSEITITADGDLGPGISMVSDAIRVTVNGAQAESLGLTIDAPTDKP